MIELIKGGGLARLLDQAFLEFVGQTGPVDVLPVWSGFFVVGGQRA